MINLLILFFSFSTSVTAPQIVPMFPAYYIFNSLLILLFVLHVIWTWMIVKVAYKSFTAGVVNNCFYNFYNYIFVLVFIAYLFLFLDGRRYS